MPNYVTEDACGHRLCLDKESDDRWSVQLVKSKDSDSRVKSFIVRVDAVQSLAAFEALGASVEHLAELVQAEQGGLLIVPPCKVGDTAWFIRNPKDVSRREVIETVVEKIVVKKSGLYLKLACNSMYETSCASIGKTVFLSAADLDAFLLANRL